MEQKLQKTEAKIQELEEKLKELKEEKEQLYDSLRAENGLFIRRISHGVTYYMTEASKKSYSKEVTLSGLIVAFNRCNCKSKIKVDIMNNYVISFNPSKESLVEITEEKFTSKLKEAINDLLH